MTTPEPAEWYEQAPTTYDGAASYIPHSREAEEATLGAILANPDMYEPVKEVISPDDFYIHRHAWIMEAIEDTIALGRPVDLMTVSEVLDGKTQLAEIGGFPYLTSLINQAPSTLNAVSYARIVEEHSIRRKLINRANALAGIAYDEATNIEDVMTNAKREMEKDDLIPSGNDDAIGADIAGLNLIGKIQAGVPSGVLTHFPNFDHYEAFGGLPKGLTMLLGDSSFGKTAWVLQIAEQVAMNGLLSDFFNFEDSNDMMVSRRVAGIAGVESRKIRSGVVTLEEEEALTEEIMLYQGRFGDPTRLRFHPKERSLRQIERAIRRHKPDLVVIDQVNQIADRPTNNKTENLIMTTTDLKSIADKHDVAMIVVHAITADESKKFFESNAKSQSNGSAKKNKLPDINAIAWATQIKYIADAILFLVPEVNQQITPDELHPVILEYLIKIWIMKDRGGDRFLGTNWKYDKVMQWWEDLPPKRQKAQVPSAQNGASK